MNNAPNFIEITDTETDRRMVVVEDTSGDYTVTTDPPFTIESVRRRSVGKRIREFMKEKNDK